MQSPIFTTNFHQVHTVHTQHKKEKQRQRRRRWGLKGYPQPIIWRNLWLPEGLFRAPWLLKKKRQKKKKKTSITNHQRPKIEFPDWVNRMITQALSGYVNTNHDDWDWHLPAAVFSINTVQQSTIEISPFQLEYGWLPFTTLGNHFPLPKERLEPFEVFLARVGEFWEAARLIIVRKHEKSKRLVDLRRWIVRDFCPGELKFVVFPFAKT